jgi:hypothetical protein
MTCTLFCNHDRVVVSSFTMSRAVLLTCLVACGGGSSTSPEPASAPSRKAADLGAMCDRYYVRERLCVDEYLAALLTVRVEYDMPPGIAAEVARDGRDVVLTRMRPEWERDTTLENTNRICRVVETKTPPDRIEGLLADGDRCYAKSDCAGFVACTVEGQRNYIKSGAPSH